MTNGAGTLSNRETESIGIDGLPPLIRQIIHDAPISLGAYGIYKHFQRMRISGDAEIEAYAVDLRAKINSIMKGGEPASTSSFWRNHPQNDKDYPWPDYQVKRKPRRNTRVTEIGTDAETDRLHT